MHNSNEAPMYFSKYSDTYIKLSKDRVIFMNEIFTKEAASAISALLIHYDSESSEEEIIMYISSDGGDVGALINIYDVMQMISAPIRTVNISKAYSAGAVLLAAGSKGRRCAFKHSSVMIHGIQCMFPHPHGLDQSDSKSYYKFLESYQDTLFKILSKHTGHSLSKIKEDIKRDWFMTAKDALNYGLIDEIVL